MTGCGGTSEAIANHLAGATQERERDPVDAPADDSSEPAEAAEPCPPDSPESVAERERAIEAAQALMTSRGLTESGAIGRALRWRLCDDALLKAAWQRYVWADSVATRTKTPVHRLSGLALALGTLTVLVAVVWSLVPRDDSEWSWLRTLTLAVVTGLPVLVVVILAAIQRRSRSGGWINMRGAAETTRREIDPFRAGADPYPRPGGAGPDETEVRARLAATLLDIDRRVDGRSAAWTEPEGGTSIWAPSELDGYVPHDSLLCPISGLDYDIGRVEDQLDYLANQGGHRGSPRDSARCDDDRPRSSRGVRIGRERPSGWPSLPRAPLDPLEELQHASPLTRTTAPLLRSVPPELAGMPCPGQAGPPAWRSRRYMSGRSRMPLPVRTRRGSEPSTRHNAPSSRAAGDWGRFDLLVG